MAITTVPSSYRDNVLIGFATVGGDLNRPLAVELDGAGKIQKLTALDKLQGVIVLTSAKVTNDPVTLMCAGSVYEASLPNCGLRQLYAYVGGDVDYLRTGSVGRRIGQVIQRYADGGKRYGDGGMSPAFVGSFDPLLCHINLNVV